MADRDEDQNPMTDARPPSERTVTQWNAIIEQRVEEAKAPLEEKIQVLREVLGETRETLRWERDHIGARGAREEALRAARKETRAAREETRAAREETRAAREETRAAREEAKAAREEGRALREMLQEILTKATIDNIPLSIIQQISNEDEHLQLQHQGQADLQLQMLIFLSKRVFLGGNKYKSKYFL